VPFKAQAAIKFDLHYVFKGYTRPACLIAIVLRSIARRIETSPRATHTAMREYLSA